MRPRNDFMWFRIGTGRQLLSNESRGSIKDRELGLLLASQEGLYTIKMADSEFLLAPYPANPKNAKINFCKWLKSLASMSNGNVCFYLYYMRGCVTSHLYTARLF